MENLRKEKVSDVKGRVKVYTFPNMDYPRTREHIEEREYNLEKSKDGSYQIEIFKTYDVFNNVYYF